LRWTVGTHIPVSWYRKVTPKAISNGFDRPRLGLRIAAGKDLELNVPL